MGNLKKNIYDQIFVNLQTIYAIGQSSTTVNEAVGIRARLSTVDVFQFALAFTSFTNIFISEKTIIQNSNNIHIYQFTVKTGEMTVTYTHGQVFGRTKSRKFAQAEAKSKINILFLIIMMVK